MISQNVFSRGQRRLFVMAFILFFLPKLVNTYFLMPFPGSMDIETMQFSYGLDKVANMILYTSGIVLLWGSILLIIKGTPAKKAGGGFLILAGITFIYLTIIYINAGEMFKEPQQIVFKPGTLSDYNPDAYILGVTDGNETKAYPIKYLAYHHKIQDEINHKPIMVTYCSMCRSARIFSPEIGGERNTFRLVGARHYNAILEDSKTKSWWYQATGEAAAGPMRGKKLTEIPGEQTTWKNWLMMHPHSLLLQPDPSSDEKYKDWFENFDKMRSPSDSIPGNRKMWVVGIQSDQREKHYPFSVLIHQRVINDNIGKSSVVIVIEKDSLTTHVWNSKVENTTLDFISGNDLNSMTDNQTGSTWNMQGKCTGGIYTGKQLKSIQHYIEYLRSWQQFHPHSEVWKPE